RTGKGQVAAACAAAHTGDVFLAFDTGDLVCFRPATGEVRFVRTGWLEGGITALAADAEGRFLVQLQARRAATEEGSRLTPYLRKPDGSFEQRPMWDTPTELGWLAPAVASTEGLHLVGASAGSEFRLFTGERLVETWWRVATGPNCCGALLFPKA